MKFLNGGNVQRLKLGEIIVGPRLRQVGETRVENLMLMSEDTGITTPIHCRKVGREYRLIDGAHRLEVTRRRGLPDIAALVVECRDDEARSMEASNNLGAARMTPLQTAVFVASWKRDYYAMHPDRAKGVFKGNQHTGKVVTEETSLTRSVAEAFGITERRARTILAAGGRLSPSEVEALETAPKKVLMEELEQIGKIGNPEERSAVVRKLALGAAKKVAEARRQFATENGAVQSPVKDPVEAAFTALRDAWRRAPMAAKKRFLFEHAHDVWEAQNKGVRLDRWREAGEAGGADDPEGAA